MFVEQSTDQKKGVTKMDLRYRFKRCYVPAFNPLWWLITVLIAIVCICSLVDLYAILVMFLIIVG